ncbi:MAG: serine/threonine protein phosphatase [Oscillospiraceae bacterium]
MGVFKRQRAKAGVSTQIRAAEQHPFGMLDNYVPLGGGDTRLYRAIREAVPVLDAAVMKLIRLTGGFRVKCRDKGTERELAEFLRTVNVGRSQRGFDAFLDNYLDSLLTCGRAVGEIVTDGNREIAALLCGNVCDVQIKEGASPLEFVLCGRSAAGQLEPFPYQELLLFTPFNPEADAPYGVSLMRSMPFLTEILLKIYNSIGINWDRAGNVRFAVVYKPQGDIIDKAYARERSEQIAREWSAAMQSGKNGSVRDFIAVGDVDIKVIGADNQILDSEVPVRQILEQLISRTGIPPFMLGLNWSSTERMSAQQADLMTSELTAIRRTLTPVVERVCDLWLRMHGKSCGFEVCWEPINLQDAVEEAKAALYLAQADKVINEENIPNKIAVTDNNGGDEGKKPETPEDLPSDENKEKHFI